MTSNASPAASAPHCPRCCTKLENLTVTAGGRSILEGVNLHFHCGELTALVGPNGAGKTTLLQAILGEVPYTGTLRFEDVVGHRAMRPRVGYVPQRIALDPQSPLSVDDLFAAALSRSPAALPQKSSVGERARATLGRVDAGHLLGRRLGALSGGEIQRVLLALAMEPVPEILLLDEPASAMDPKGTELFYQAVAEIRRRFDLAVILVSHDLPLAAEFADRVILLNRRVLADGPPLETLSSPESLSLFGHVPLTGRHRDIAPYQHPDLPGGLPS